MSSSWRIELQSQGRDGATEVKHVRFYPKNEETEDGKEKFGRLPFFLLRVILVNVSSGYTLQLGLSCAKDTPSLQYARYSVTHVTPPAPGCRAVKPERYSDLLGFLARLRELGGMDLAREVAFKLEEKFWQVVAS